MQPRRPRIVWTPDELGQVLAMAKTIYHRFQKHEITLMQLFAMAQQALPQERQRHLHDASTSQLHEKLLAELGLPSAKRGPVPRKPAIEQPVQPQAIAPTVPTVEAPKPSEPVVLAPDLSDPIEALLLTLLDRPKVQTRLFQLIEAHYGIQPTDFKKHEVVDMPTLVRRVHLPRILVVGLKGHQITEVKEATKDMFQVSFWNTERSLQELKKMASKSMHAFAHIDHLSHSAEAVLKARSPHYVPVPGGVDAIKAAILAHSMVNTNGVNHE